MIKNILEECPFCSKGHIIEENNFIDLKISCSFCHTEFEKRNFLFRVKKFGSKIKDSLNPNIVKRKDEWHSISDWKSLFNVGYTTYELPYRSLFEGNLEELPNTDNIELKEGEKIYLKESNVIFGKPDKENSDKSYNRVGGIKNLIKGFEGKYFPTRQEIRAIDYGKLFLTNRRILFKGDKNELRSIDFDEIDSIIPYSDSIGITLKKDFSSLYFIMEDSRKWYASIIGIALKDD